MHFAVPLLMAGVAAAVSHGTASGPDRAWALGSAPSERAEGPRVLVIGVGGGQIARVANSLARAGLQSDVCSVPCLPFLPEEPAGYEPWEGVILGPIPGGARAFTRGQLQALAGYVKSGGGIVFVGGMDSFSGASGRGHCAGTPLAEIMPVDLVRQDDYLRRDETPEPCADHPVLAGLPETWPPIGERNRQPARDDAEVLVRFREDPLLVVREVGKGRSAALLTAWGWEAQHAFTLWSGYARLWPNLCRWVGRIEAPEQPLDLDLRVGGGDAFRFEARNGRPLLRTPSGERTYLYGTSVEVRSLEFIARSAEFGLSFHHLWDASPQGYARACAVVQAHRVKLGLFVPQVGPFARFHDGSTSGSNIPYDSPWHRVPDFYDPAWEPAFRQACREMREAIEPYPEVVAILWVTNEPEIYRGWANWQGPDFCINTPATLAAARRHAEERYRDIESLSRDWGSPAGHEYSFASWDDFEKRVLDELLADYRDDQLNLSAHRWLVEFVCSRWLRDWHAAVRRIVREVGLTSPVLGVRHNYNSVPDLALLPWDDLDVCGKNLYTYRNSNAYVHETWDAFRASGLPVLMSEWGVQPTKPPLGHVGGDEVTRAEQAALGRILASRCPWVVGDIWSNVQDIDYPWGLLWPNGQPKPFVALLARAAAFPPVRRWDPVSPGTYELSTEAFSAPGVRIWRTQGDPNRQPGVEFD